jgi:hypothetical protein
MFSISMFSNSSCISAVWVWISWSIIASAMTDGERPHQLLLAGLFAAARTAP